MNKEKLTQRLKEINEEIELYEYELKHFHWGKWKARAMRDMLLNEKKRLLKKLNKIEEMGEGLKK